MVYRRLEAVKKIMSYLMIFVLAITLGGALFYLHNIHTPRTILRTALSEKHLYGKSYILCTVERTTGFDWIVIKNENGEKTSEMCNVSGINPFEELTLNYDLKMSNIFIFYIVEKKMVYNRAIDGESIEYVASGWDILYPVRRNPFSDLFSPRRFITVADLWIDMIV